MTTVVRTRAEGSAGRRHKLAAPVPDLFIRGAETYAAHINADNPAGTIRSTEHTLCALDKIAEDERHRIERLEKTLSDYQAQANRPFEHDTRLKELLARQTQLSAALDLDKSDAQAAQAATQPDVETAVTPYRQSQLRKGSNETLCQPRSSNFSNAFPPQCCCTGRETGPCRCPWKDRGPNRTGKRCKGRPSGVCSNVELGFKTGILGKSQASACGLQTMIC